MGLCHVLRHIGQPEPDQRCIEHLECAVEDQLAFDMHLDLAPVLLEFPCVESAMRRQTQIDAIMPDQLLRPLRFRAPLEIRGSPHDSAAHVRTDTHRDHVLRHLLAATYPGVKPFGDDVGQAIVDDGLDLHIGIAPQEPREFRPEDRFDSIICRGNADGTRRFLAKLAQSRKLALDLLEPRADRMKEALARLSWRHAARCAGQQP